MSTDHEEPRLCDYCAKRGPWRREAAARASIVVVADCTHRPLPPFWASIGSVQVMPGCGSQCIHFIPRRRRLTADSEAQ